MTDKATDESAPAPQEPPNTDGVLTDQQLEQVAGAAGRQLQDCEGYSYMTKQVLGDAAAKTAAKSE